MNVKHYSKLMYGFAVLIVFLLAMSLAVTHASQTVAFSPEKGNWPCNMLYALDDADPNEPVEVIEIYWKGVELMREGRWKEAQSWFTDGILRYPDSRHLHEGLTQVLWYLAIDGAGGSVALEHAAQEVVQAVEIGLKFGKVRHTWLLAQVLGKTSDMATFSRLFEQALALDPTFEVVLDYARGLSLLDNPDAEDIYRRAIELQPEGNIDAVAYYGEWLLGHKRADEVLMLIPTNAHAEYLHFLRGVALERLGRLDEAKAEYDQFVTFSVNFPAPNRYRITASKAQAGIQFEGNVRVNATDGQAVVGLSTLLKGEAGGDGSGQQRAEGWVVRNRVLRGSVSGCPYVQNSGATYADKYKSVMCQSGQFDAMCSAWCSNPSTTTCPTTPSTNHNANDVYYGYAPDPVASGGYCPAGYDYNTCNPPHISCSPCDSNVHCNGANTTGYSTAGGLFNYGTSGSCPSQYIGPGCPPTSRGKVCGNGGSDNCFYTNP
ncbi:MAG TPA: tetratricopeptide repeat protein [Anaerolineae bacterium]|nr:tetratricopeptide repeat protein [Anaerolineae bacterium]HQH39083.1 tetratricopeptide repeat protein [Anaerolineae bacterium]